jgi:hypothetical protein
MWRGAKMAKDIRDAAATLGRKGGQATSDAKAKASRENGKKGGRLPSYYCGMCEQWFTRSKECPKCGFDLERSPRQRAGSRQKR